MQQPPQPAAIAALPAGGGGPPIPPPPQPLVQLPPPINAAPRSYRAYYADPRTDLYNGNYQEALAYFRLIPGVNPTPQVAANRVYAAAAREPLALIVHCRDAAAAANDPGLIQVDHRLSLYFPQMGRALQWDSQAFAFVGDLVLQMVQSVGIPGDAFSQVNAFSVPNAVVAQAAFAADPALATLGPYANNDPDTDQYRSRRIMYMPHRYVNLLLNQGLPPRRTWEVVTAAITADNAEVACAPLLDWL